MKKAASLILRGCSNSAFIILTMRKYAGHSWSFAHTSANADSIIAGIMESPAALWLKQRRKIKARESDSNSIANSRRRSNLPAPAPRVARKFDAQGLPGDFFRAIRLFQTILDAEAC